MSYISRTEEIANKKKQFAKDYFKKKYPTETEREEKEEILQEILYQIEVCEDFCRPVNEEKIKEWFECKNVEQVLRKARTHKYAA